MSDRSSPVGSPADLSGILAVQKLALPDLDGWEKSDAFTSDAPVGDFAVSEACGALVGRARFAAGGNLDELALSAYRKLFAASEGWEVARIWNVIPEVNRAVDGLENYRAFNVGRARACDEKFGESTEAHMPAATGIGGFGSFLHVSFVAVKTPLVRLENPWQVPAYRYPEKFGPRAPAFSRAIVTEIGGAKLGFVSGTAAVRGCESVGRTLAGECAATIDNLRIMEDRLVSAGFSADMARHVNVFIRRREDATQVLDLLSRHWARPTDRVRIYSAEICRAELSLEIEFTAVSA
ncbi:MAG TPA: hypothetical protein PKI32_08495 [Opitutales bacterium]|nr:hypothetical protein [Opitutales bacterium]